MFFPCQFLWSHLKSIGVSSLKAYQNSAVLHVDPEVLSLEGLSYCFDFLFLLQKAPDGLSPGPKLCQYVQILLPVCRGLRNVFF